MYIFKILLLLPFFFIFGCSEVPRFVIRNKAFFEFPVNQSEVSGFKISSQDEFHQYINKREFEMVREHLRDMKTISFTRSFLYITINAELVEIRSISGVSVSNAILRKSLDKGLWVYVIDGDPKVPVKAVLE